jgi:hypothetical protein
MVPSDDNCCAWDVVINDGLNDDNQKAKIDNLPVLLL